MKLNIYIGEKVNREHLAKEINDSDCKYHIVNDTYLLQEHEQREFLERLKHIDKSAQWEEKKLASIKGGKGFVELRKTLNVIWSDRLPKIEHIHLYGAEIINCGSHLEKEFMEMCKRNELKRISIYFLTDNITRRMGGDLTDALIDIAQEWHCQYLPSPYPFGNIVDGCQTICNSCPNYYEPKAEKLVTDTKYCHCKKTSGMFRRQRDASWKLFVNENCPYYVEHYMEWLKEKNNANVHRATK